MPVQKLGQLSVNQVSDIQQKHFDVDMKLRDILSLLSYDVKLRLASRLQGFADQIKMEMDSEGNGNSGQGSI